MRKWKWEIQLWISYFHFRNYIDDDSGPIVIAIQVGVTNHPKVLYSKDMVLSVREKATIKLSGKYYGDEWPYEPLTKVSLY